MSSSPNNSDPRLDQAAASDESLIAAHEKLLGKKPDDQANYRLLPLNLLFVFSGLIFFGGSYLNKFSGHFDPHIYDEHALPHVGGPEVAKIDPVVYGKKLFNNAACNTCHQITQSIPGSLDGSPSGLRNLGRIDVPNSKLVSNTLQYLFEPRQNGA